MPLSIPRTLVFAGIVAALYVGATSHGITPETITDRQQASSAAYHLARDRQDALNAIHIKINLADTSYQIARIGLTIKNENTFSIKDVAINCDFFAPSGTIVSSRRETVFEIIKAHGSKKMAGVNFGFVSDQTKNLSCRAVDYTTLPQ